MLAQCTCPTCGRIFKPRCHTTRFCSRGCVHRKAPVAARFWERVAYGGGGCWPWTGSIDRGYGKFSVRVKGRTGTVRAHRLAFRLAYGRWPRYTCHRCNNPACCRPSHLYEGTPLTNAADRKLVHQKPAGPAT